MATSNCPAPEGLRCEYAVNPIGIDEQQPRLFWRLADTRRGARQTAYEIACASVAAKLDAADVWSSGKVTSDRTTHVVYEGPVLRSGQRVWWRVRVWDQDGVASPWSEPVFWEMGLRQNEWRGRWIAADVVGGPRTSVPAPFMRKGFTLDKPIAAGRLYVTALGLYEAHCNGTRIGDDVFTPGWTDYSKRVQYQTYDVTSLLQQGDNVLGAILGDGWYCGHVCWAGRQIWGDRPKLRAQLVVAHTDGSTSTITTDGSWRYRCGPIVEADLLMGESYDARLEMPGWSASGFDDAAWHDVTVADDPAIPIVASASPRVRRVMEIKPIDDGRHGTGWEQRFVIFDLGQNIAGRVRLRVKGHRGATLVIRYAEMLNADGSLYTANLRQARATDHYTFRGDEVEAYEPRFTFHGFRYVEISSRGNPFTIEEIAGVVLMSDTPGNAPASGTFDCSDPLVNQLQSNIQWGQRGNFLEVPTDCPQRNERLGWTGDAQIFVPTACFNADVAGFFTKWTIDLDDAQPASGSYPSVAPNRGFVSDDGGPAWAEAGVICPWTIHLNYGDTRLLERHYDSMCRFVAFLEKTSDNCIRPHGEGVYEGYGDWLAIDAPHPGSAPTPRKLIGTAYFARSTELLARIAAVLGKSSDASKYTALRDRVREAFCREFVTPGGQVVGNSQTGYLLALAFDMLPEALRPAAVNHLVETIARANWHLTTGFVGTPLLCETLSRFGQHDVAWRVFRQETYPGWLYSVLQGATTMWERWNSYTKDKGFGDAGMNSFNHYAYGSIGRWLYSTIAGIDAPGMTPESVGYKTIRLAPTPPPGAALTHARATHDSIHGRIECAWHIDGDRLHIDVLIPPNTTGSLQLPGELIEHDAGEPAWSGDRICALPAGRYQFTCRWPTA